MLVAEGRVDAEGGDPKLLVDRLEELDLEEALKVQESPEIDLSAYVPPSVAAVYGGRTFGDPVEDGEENGLVLESPALPARQPLYVSPSRVHDDGIASAPDDWHMFEPNLEDDPFDPAEFDPLFDLAAPVQNPVIREPGPEQAKAPGLSIKAQPTLPDVPAEPIATSAGR